MPEPLRCWLVGFCWLPTQRVACVHVRQTQAHEKREGTRIRGSKLREARKRKYVAWSEALVTCLLTTWQLINCHCSDYASADRDSTLATLPGHVSVLKDACSPRKSRARDFYFRLYFLLVAIFSLFLCTPLLFDILSAVYGVLFDF